MSPISGAAALAMMVILGQNRSELQKKCGMPDQGVTNFVLNSPPLAACGLIECLQCQVSKFLC